jgi:hypothetical protein
MAVSMRPKYFRAVFVCISLLFLFGGTVSAFSQEVLATFIVGGQNLKNEVPENYWNGSGLTQGVNVLFVGKSGFTVATGTNITYKTSDDGGVSFCPELGLGYLYYNVFYLGALFDVVFNNNIRYNFVPRYQYTGGYNTTQVLAGWDWYDTDGFLGPTFVGGFDFRHFVLEVRLSYIRGVMSGINGFRGSVGIGINAGKGW